MNADLEFDPAVLVAGLAVGVPKTIADFVLSFST